MDRTAWIAVALCVVGLVLWELYLVKQTPPRRASIPTAPQQISPVPTAAASGSPPPVVAAPEIPSKAAETTPSFPEKIETLRNSDVELHLTNRGGGIKEAVLLKQVAEKGQRVILNSAECAPIGAIIEQPSAPAFPEFTASPQSNSAVQFERTTPEQIIIRKKFFFEKSPEEKDNFVIEMDVDVENRGPNPYQAADYFVALGSAAPIHPRDYPYYTRLVWCIDGKAKGIDVGWFGGGGGFLGMGQRAARPLYQQNIGGAEWVAVSDQFFTTLLAPLTGKATQVWGRRFDITRSPDEKLLGIEGALGMPGFQLQPGQTYSARFEIYAGPKLYHRLAQLPHNEAEVMDFGMFKLVCQFLLNFMNLLHSWLGNYAAAILALTTIIKLGLWPIQNRANRSMRQMSALSPKMQELREKYKDDPLKLQKKTMELYSQHGVKPMASCLPMLLQIPVFFGFLQMIRSAIELRGAPWLWVADLSKPDTLFMIPGLGFIPYIGIEGQGLPFNLLPLLMGATMLWQARLTPPSPGMDPTQQAIMKYLPLIFLVGLYNFSAGMTLYWTVNNLLTILQTKLTRTQPTPPAGAPAKALPAKAAVLTPPAKKRK